MNPEWIKWAQENIPDEILKEMQSEIQWAAKWRDTKIARLISERDRLREALKIASLHLGKIADLTDARTHNFVLSCKKDIDAALQEDNDETN